MSTYRKTGCRGPRLVMLLQDKTFRDQRTGTKMNVNDTSFLQEVTGSLALNIQTA